MSNTNHPAVSWIPLDLVGRRVLRDFGHAQFSAEYGCHHVVLEGGILLSRGQGYMNGEAAEAVLRRRREVLVECGYWDRPHIEIMTQPAPWVSPSPGAQRRFSRFLIDESRRGMLRGYHGVAVPASTRWLLRIGTHVYRLTVPMRFFHSMEEALAAVHSPNETFDANVDLGTPRWHLHSDGLTQDAWLVDGNVVVMRVAGTIRARHIEPLAREDRKIWEDSGFDAASGYARVIDVSGVGAVTWAGRRAYIRYVREAEKRMPCRVVVFVGANRTIRSIVSAFGVLMPNPIYFADDIPTARSMIRSAGLPVINVEADAGFRWPSKWPWIRRSTVEREFNALLEYVDRLDWDRAGTPELGDAQSSPMLPIFEATASFKRDCDFVIADREELRRQLEQSNRMASLGTITAGLAHELRNPLTIILGYCRALHGKDAETDKAVARIEEAAHRMTAITDHFRTVARSDQSNRQQSVDARLALRHALIGLESRARSLGIQLLLPEKGEGPHLLGNPADIETVLRNLITNAVDALESARDRKSPSVEVRFEERDDIVVVSVMDNGPGMTDDVRERLFDPYFTTKGEGRGTGLGMAMVHGIIERMKGTVRVESTVGVGTRFDLSLPRAASITRE